MHSASARVEWCSLCMMLTEVTAPEGFKEVSESGRRKGKAPGVCDASSVLKRVFGTGGAAAGAVGRERHTGLGYIL